MSDALLHGDRPRELTTVSVGVTTEETITVECS